MKPVATFKHAVYGREQEMALEQKMRASPRTTGTLTELNEVRKFTPDELISQIGAHAQ
ncbi:MAG: hypothetical protein HOH36_07015 [Acidimicrobiaceae bacterium]|jgi:hypothetical protein|nr:hypothetical protein [Acidimicrobiaceae bacterium]MBT5581079.1 hypothetical protein [Acidimicrobiaceae bacterium]MBT5850168.1 hypothetical protein [Acidimicrobiaceae bacterium]